METLGKHFQKLAKSVMQNHGFAQADLLSNWVEIAGRDISRIAKPERIKWPRKDGSEPVNGGILIVGVTAGRALDVQYQAPQLIERINQFFGYAAVAGLKIQPAAAAITPAAKQPTAIPVASEALLEQVRNIDNNELKEVLARLGANVLAKPSPQRR